MAKRLIGPFELESQLGVGGMGVVYLATYVKTGQKVAVKVLPPGLSSNKQLTARFEREMAILKKLRHEHIVRYYGGGRHGDQHFYAMELMTGGSLEQILKQKTQLPWEQVIEIAMQVAKALEHAHNHSIIHRDLKPGNLFFGRNGTLKLGDFGIARDNQATALTAAGKTVGTYAYMAPEQIVGKPPISRKTDLYALGCLMYEMLTGGPPFQAETAAEMLFQHIEQAPPRLTSSAVDCPVWLETVVMKLLEKDPEDRYYDALAVQVALEEVGKKIAENESFVRQTASGGETVGTSAKERSALAKLLSGKPKKKKKAKFVPLYERGWFLAGCLLLVILGLTWVMWPLNEQQLFTRAEPLLASEDSLDWDKARNYLDPLLERFPEGAYASKAREFIDEIEMRKAEKRAEANARFGRDPTSEAERKYVEALEFEKFGDRVTAVERYKSLAVLFSNDPQDKPFVNLARKRVKNLESEGQDDNRAAVITRALDHAADLYSKGQTMPAQNIWRSIVTLYGSNQEFRPLVEQAQARLDGRPVESPERPAPDTPPPTENQPQGAEDEADQSALAPARL